MSGATAAPGSGTDKPATTSSGKTPVPSTGGRPTTGGRTTEASRNGLAEQVTEVEAARMRLGHDLQHLNANARAQMGLTVEKIAWKLAVVLSAVVAGVGTQKVLSAGWKAAIKTEPPTNPANPSTGWGEALSWTVATAASAAVAKIVAARAAAAGWEKATGHMPPGLER
jgi:hypothetical protein